MQTSIDELMQPRSSENYPVKVIQFPLHDCEVCGLRKLILKNWNERRVCLDCIGELTADA